MAESSSTALEKAAQTALKVQDAVNLVPYVK